MQNDPWHVKLRRKINVYWWILWCNVTWYTWRKWEVHFCSWLHTKHHVDEQDHDGQDMSWTSYRCTKCNCYGYKNTIGGGW